MKRYTITVNGTPYDVVVEEGGQGVAPVAATEAATGGAAATPAPAAIPGPAPVPAAATPAMPAVPAGAVGAVGAVTVAAPMPGQVLDIKYKVGEAFKTGDVLVVLEAMKMENEVVAAQDGVVATVDVTKGDMVNAGDIFLTFN